ncbi:hypothetical protein DFH06DRAFT_1229992 [Mycena polygramma]|nr:hypothetical protein DFH06DRAFT_1229992 [Mycena polygramma]
MSSNPLATSAMSAVLYRYVVVGALSIVICIGLTLFWRSRIIERQRARLVPIQQPEDAIASKPRVYDAYLDGHGEFWHDTMPLSIRRDPWPEESTKHPSLSLDLGPQLSAQLIVALLVTMPSSEPPSRTKLASESSAGVDTENENGEGPPYLEFGIAKVEVPGGISDCS